MKTKKTRRLVLSVCAAAAMACPNVASAVDGSAVPSDAFVWQGTEGTDFNTPTAITIDEMYLFPHERPSRKYVTIVRDVVTGRVLSVTRGKGANALRQFAWRLRRYKGKIRYVCIDMSQAYSAWVVENLPKAKVVFDHFHLIKAMIEKMDHVRRREMAKLDYEAKRTIKGHRFVFIRNEENLDAKGQRILGELRASNLQLADAHMLKEQLRRVYTFCETRYDAKSALEDWCQAARASGIFEMCQMANMVEKHLFDRYCRRAHRFDKMQIKSVMSTGKGMG